MILNGGVSHSGLFIADSTRFIRFELKEPTADKFSEAIGFVEYSNSKVGVYSARSFYELLWNEHIQYEKLKEADIMKSEFINIAAHELRTPIQPILGLSQGLKSKLSDSKQRELLDVIIRNAKRLQRLTNEILDVTKIESHSLNLNKERFNLSHIIISILEDANIQHKNSDRKLKLLYEPYNQSIFVEADKERITQVISNLLSNAIKFTEEGTISVDVEVGRDNGNNSNNSQSMIVVSIKDSGKGINPEILPRLFTKFGSRSSEGTGLGLYISKNIIEAHGGKMWAENNNSDVARERRRRGATFCFSLPLINEPITKKEGRRE